MHLTHEEGRDAFTDGLTVLWDAVAGLDDRALLAPSRCHGWAVADVLVHVHLGLQDLLLALHAPTDAEPDRDAATYWTAPPPRTDPDADDVAGVRFVRLLASAYRRPRGLLGHLRPTVEGVLAAVTALPPGRLRFQGHVLTTGDFLATWACEVAVHHLDVAVALPLPAPHPRALAVARATVGALAGAPLPASTPDDTVVLMGTGRVPADPALLGTVPASALPVLG